MVGHGGSSAFLNNTKTQTQTCMNEGSAENVAPMFLLTAHCQGHRRGGGEGSRVQYYYVILPTRWRSCYSLSTTSIST